jgi:hypothetical protein
VRKPPKPKDVNAASKSLLSQFKKIKMGNQSRNNLSSGINRNYNSAG